MCGTVLVLQVIQYSVYVYVWVYCELNVYCNTYLPSLILCTVYVIVCVAQYTY